MCLHVLSVTLELNDLKYHLKTFISSRTSWFSLKHKNLADFLEST